MKNKLLPIILLISISLFPFSCKKAIKPAPKVVYSIETKTTTINWTAYKTTAKLPVKGIFKDITVKNSKPAENANAVINGIEFSVPVKSIDTKDLGRDAKIVQHFFGTMKDTESLIGKISLGEKGKGNINLTMNGISANLPMTYIVSGQLIEMDATMNLDNWQAQLAITALNKVCGELHKGDDGISKTWNEVNIHIASYLKVE